MALTKVIGNGTGDITKLQILNGSNVRAASSDADDLIVEGPADCGISILSATTGRIYFGDAANDDAGSIRYVHSDDSMRFETNDVEAMRISSIGAVTKPLQPSHTVPALNERFDQNSDYNNSTYTFTAPVTGKYQLNANFYVHFFDDSTNYAEFLINTSNRVYRGIIDNSLTSGDVDNYNNCISVLADMDASDTAHMQINIPNSGTAQMRHSNLMTFSGYLVA